MLRNYIRTAIRNLLKHRTTSVIHIAGLMVGIAAFLIIFLVVRFEESYDSFRPGKADIYRVVRIGRDREKNSYRTGVPIPVTIGLRKDLPQIRNVGAMLPDGNVQVIVRKTDGTPEKKFREMNGIYFVEPQMFAILHFGVVAGDPARALVAPNNVFLDKEMAAKYFGDWRSAMGKTIHFDDMTLTVAGILDNPPPNTDFPVKAALSYSSLAAYANMSDWGSIMDANYCMVALDPGTSRAEFDRLLLSFTDKYIKPVDDGYFLALQPLADMHYDARYGNYSGKTFSKDLILALNLISLFLLVIACVNFINLTTVQAITRSREVGVRKVLGSNRRQLMMQILAETGLTVALALLAGLGVVALCLPAVNHLLDISLSMSMLISAQSLTILALLLAGVTTLSGLYPAFILSGFRPAAVLKTTLNGDRMKGVSFRRGLVVFQFVIAQVLIMGTLVVASQMEYFRTADMGFKKDAIITAGFPTDSAGLARVGLLRNLLTDVPGIRAISFSSATPASGGNNYTDLRKPGNTSKDPDMIINLKGADTAYYRLFGLQFAAGRPYYPSDTLREIVVNEKVAHGLGYAHPQDAIGKMANFGGRNVPIVGVMKDFHTNSLRDPIDPVVMTPRRNYDIVSVKIDMARAPTVIAAMEKVWNNVYPDYSFDYSFLDQTIADFYQQENQLSILYKVFAGIAIFISCLGLYGLIAFMAIQRRKEIGIRKVLGASVQSILLIMSREFTILIGFAFLIAAPVAWYFGRQWLDQYTYRIAFGLGFFLVTILGSIAIAWLTVGYTAIRAALANPVASLRSE